MSVGEMAADAGKGILNSGKIVFVIAGRELRGIFNTTIGWLVMAGFLFLTGLFWANMVSFYVEQSTDLVSNPYAASQLSYTDYLLAPYFGNTAIVLIMLCPALSMRLFSEEIKQRTLELLLTSPVSTFEIVTGKFFGAVGFVACMLAATAFSPISLMIWGDPDLGAIAAGYLGLLLIASAVIAMGMMFSSMTANQIVALVWTFSGSLALWVLSWVSQDPDSIFQKLALISHVDDMLRGVVQRSDLVYFAAIIGFFLFATWQRVESHRWR